MQWTMRLKWKERYVVDQRCAREIKIYESIHTDKWNSGFFSYKTHDEEKCWPKKELPEDDFIFVS